MTLVAPTRALVLASVAALGLLASAGCNHPKLLLDANAENLRTARTVASAFYRTYGAEVGLADVPFVTVGVEGGPGYSYDVAHNVLFVTPYSHADFDTQKFFARAAADYRGEPVYDELLFRFFVAHQLMHLVYDELALVEVDEYEEERRIHTLAWLFLERQGLTGAVEHELLETCDRLVAQLASRFPSLRGADAQAHRGLLVDDNASYWYVNAHGIREARAEARRVGSEPNYIAELSGSAPSAGTVGR